MRLFFQPEISLHPFLSEAESHHAVKVLRMKPGDELDIADGKGTWYKAEILKADARRCEVKILNRRSVPPRSHFIHLAIAPTKNMDRIEWMLEKCVEIGVDEISFLETRYSERRALKLERLQQVAVSALKQSGQAWLPQLNGLQPWNAFLTNFLSGAATFQYFVAHLAEGERNLLQHLAHPGGKYLILIGPEGDFSPEEISQSLQAGFQPVSLGPSRLRTETAGLIAVHTLNLLNQ